MLRTGVDKYLSAVDSIKNVHKDNHMAHVSGIRADSFDEESMTPSLSICTHTDRAHLDSVVMNCKIECHQLNSS